MAAMDPLGFGKMAQFLPFATFTDAGKMAEAALAAKTLVAEVRHAAASQRWGGLPAAANTGIPASGLSRLLPLPKCRGARDATRR
jgi:hypothetical protein